MKILYFHQHFGTPEGSTGTRSYEFARALVAQKHQVTVICGAYSSSGVNLAFDRRNNWSRGVIDGIEVIVLPLAYSNRDGLARRAIQFVRYALRGVSIALREPCDIIFATSTPLTAGIPGIVAKALKRRLKFIFEVRDLWPELPRALGMRNPFALAGMTALEWVSYWMADGCIGLSPGIVEGIRRRSPISRRIAMIPNGCDLDLFRPGRRSDLELGGIGPDDFVGVFTGVHGPANGLDAVLDAAAELLRRGRPEIKLVLVGDGREKDRLMGRAERERLSNCLFLPPVRKLELAHITGCCDCGLMVLANVPAFYYGTSPNKFFDYISAGIPVLVNYPGWMAEMIADRNCGAAVPPGDPEAFAATLCALADDPARRAGLGRNARRLAEESFSRAKLARQFVAFVESVGGG